MLGGCIVSGNYAMQADIYVKTRIVKPSGQFDETWILGTKYGTNGTIDCNITTFSSASFRLQPISETFSEKYRDLQYLMFRCRELLPANIRITNIVNKQSGQHMFIEPEIAGTPDTWFNSNGASPVIDPFGKILEYESTIHRAEVQGA